jgi:hypothetical protein
VSSSYVGTTSEVWVNSPFSEASYVVGQYNSTYYYAKNCTTGKYDFGDVAVSGGYVSSNAKYVIQSANNVADDQLIFLKKADYSLSGLTISKRVHLLAEKGTRFTLTAKPSITVNAETKFEGIEFYTTVDGDGHVVIQADITFEKCKFNFPVNCGEGNAVLRSNPTTPNNVLFDDCTITVLGNATATYPNFLVVSKSAKSIKFKDFTINEIVGYTSPRVIEIRETGTTVDWLDLKDITVKDITLTAGNSAAFFLKVSSPAILTKLTCDGFMFDGTCSWVGDNQYLNPFSFFTVADNIQLTNMIFKNRIHMTLQGRSTEISNMIYKKNDTTDTFNYCIDLAASSTYPLYVSITNCQFWTGASIDMNTGWAKLTLSNCIFLSKSRVAIYDEGSPKGQEKIVTIDNCQFTLVGTFSGTQWDTPIMPYWSQGIYLSKLLISNTVFENFYNTITGGTPLHPTLIILDRVIVKPKYDVGHPHLFGSTRAADTVFWIFNSEITTVSPPLGGASISTDDRFKNVKWINTADDSVTYSENSGTATITSGTSVTFNHNLVTTPTFVSCSFNATGWGSWKWSATATQITITVETSGNYTVYWTAKVTP